MNLFSSLFGNTENEKSQNEKLPWIPLVDLGQLNEIIMLSETQPVIIFKHSTRCGISKMALKQFESDFDVAGLVVPYFLDLLEHRDISNAVATRFGVEHQSPQLLAIKEGKVLYEASHGSIDAKRLAELGLTFDAVLNQ